MSASWRSEGRRGLESAGGLVLSWGDWRECGGLDVDEV